jgi:hypothetical protein
VYFYPKTGRLEVEEPIYYEEEEEIWRDVERLLKRDVEVVVLNRIPATVAFSAIRGTVIVIKDWRIYLDFMEMVIFDAIDFRTLFIEDFLSRYEGRDKGKTY